MCHAAIEICHRCDRRGKAANFVALCTVNGRDIVLNAQARDCPKNLFPKDLVCEDPKPAGGPRLPWRLRLRWWLFRQLGLCLYVSATWRPIRWVFVREGDRGAGDTIARMIHWLLAPVRIVLEDRILRQRMLVSAYRAASGQCSTCGDMQGKLNNKFPYSAAAG